jgi:predicted carbohydrate-binding protein with CBM5 and CBM33 domain
MTTLKLCECAADNLSARAMLAACGAVARSDEALEAVAAARARGYPDAYIASAEFAYCERRSAAHCVL